MRANTPRRFVIDGVSAQGTIKVMMMQRDKVGYVAASTICTVQRTTGTIARCHDTLITK